MKKLIYLFVILSLGFSDPVTIQTLVRPTDIDRNNHLNNARYAEYFQCGRWAWFKKNNLTDEKLCKSGFAFVLLSSNINYRNECFENECVSIISKPRIVSEKVFAFDQKIIKVVNERVVVVSDAVITMITIDINTRKSCTRPEKLEKILSGN